MPNLWYKKNNVLFLKDLMYGKSISVWMWIIEIRSWTNSILHLVAHGKWNCFCRPSFNRKCNELTKKENNSIKKEVYIKISHFQNLLVKFKSIFTQWSICICRSFNLLKQFLLKPWNLTKWDPLWKQVKAVAPCW